MLEKYNVKKTNLDIETHEVFLDALAKKNEDEVGISEKKFEVPIESRKSHFIFSFFLILVVFLFSKVFYFQVVQGKKIAVEAENNKGSATLIIPERGIIYDKNLKQLVLNSPAYDLTCDRNYFSGTNEETQNKIEKISSIFNISKDDFSGKINSSDSAKVIIAEDLSHENLLKLGTEIDNIPECKIIKNTIRNYVFGQSFSHLLGYMGRINKDEYANSSGYSINDYIGKIGLEKFYENNLRGIPGQSREDILNQPTPGHNLVLNIDAELQNLIYKALDEKLKEIGAKKGAAVAVDPRNGAVLAMISYPSYDNNDFSGGISVENFQKLQSNPYQPIFNRVISSKYPTGSVIKPLEAAAALEEKIISPKKQIDDKGYIEIRSQYDPNVAYRFTGIAPHGWVDMRKAIAVSSNIYFYTIGGGYADQIGLGPWNLKKYLSLFGWDQKTGIDLPGEFSGFIPDPEWKKKTKGERWVDGDTYNLSIGQSDLQVSPLQVAMAYSAIANGGTLYRPQIVNKILEGSGQLAKIIKQFFPEKIRENFIDKENLTVVREGMRDAVVKDYGLSRSLNSLPVSSASKTGTVQIPVPDKYNVWSVTFAPYENPEIVLVVTAEEVNALGAVTLPVSKEALLWYFSEK